MMMPTFESHDVKSMPKKTSQNQASWETKYAYTKATLASDNAYFQISRCKKYSQYTHQI